MLDCHRTAPARRTQRLKAFPPSRMSGGKPKTAEKPWDSCCKWPKGTMLKIGGQTIPTKTVVLLASESLLIVLGLALATALRFIASTWDYAGGHTVARFLVVVLICEFALYYNDLYDLQVMNSRAR